MTEYSEDKLSSTLDELAKRVIRLETVQENHIQSMQKQEQQTASIIYKLELAIERMANKVEQLAKSISEDRVSLLKRENRYLILIAIGFIGTIGKEVFLKVFN